MKNKILEIFNLNLPEYHTHKHTELVLFGLKC